MAGEAFLFTHPVSHGNKAAVGSDRVFWIHYFFTKGAVQIDLCLDSDRAATRPFRR